MSLLYKLKTSSKDRDDLSIGMDRDGNRRQREFTSNKNQKGKYYIRIYLKGFFAFAEHQEKITYGLGFKLTLKRKSHNPFVQR